MDQLFPYYPGTVDPQLATAAARVKDMKDALEVRDELLKAFAQAREKPISAARLADAKSMRATASCARSTTPSPSPPPWRVSCGTAAPTAP